MDPVALVQLGDAGHALEQARQQRDTGGAGHVPERLGEPVLVVLAEFGGRGDPGQQHPEAASFRLPDHGPEVVHHHVHRDAAQPVVPAERDDHQLGVRVPVEHEGKAPQPARGGLPGHPGVHDAVLEPLGVEAFLQPRRPGLVEIDAVAGREAVPEGDERGTRVVLRGSGRRRGRLRRSRELLPHFGFAAAGEPEDQSGDQEVPPDGRGERSSKHRRRGGAGRFRARSPRRKRGSGRGAARSREGAKDSPCRPRPGRRSPPFPAHRRRGP